MPLKWDPDHLTLWDHEIVEMVEAGDLSPDTLEWDPRTPTICKVVRWAAVGLWSVQEGFAPPDSAHPPPHGNDADEL